MEGKGLPFLLYYCPTLRIFRVISWEPVFHVYDCDPRGRHCSISGFEADFLSLLSSRLNFTYELSNETSGDWGVLPAEGTPFNLSGQWSGFMGAVINNRVDVGVYNWLWVRERAKILNYVPVKQTRTVLAIRAGRQTADFAFFFRPMKSGPWILAVVVGLAAAAFFARPEEDEAPGMPPTDGKRTLATVFCGFFALMNAYYCGALTMFLATSPDLPFDTLRGVLRAYPEWRLMIQAGTEVHFAQKVAGDLLFLNRLINRCFLGDGGRSRLQGLLGPGHRGARGEQVRHRGRSSLDYGISRGQQRCLAQPPGELHGAL